MNRKRMRSPLGRALGLGSAKNGVEQWWLERVSAIALVPLTVWFAASIIAHTGSDYVTFIAWLRDADRDDSDGAPFDRALLSHGARPPSGDRGLRPLRNEDSSAASNALWLFCAGRRRHLGDPADRFWRLTDNQESLPVLACSHLRGRPAWRRRFGDPQRSPLILFAGTSDPARNSGEGQPSRPQIGDERPPGHTFMLRADLISPEARALLRSVARVVLLGVRGEAGLLGPHSRRNGNGLQRSNTMRSLRSSVPLTPSDATPVGAPRRVGR